MRPRRCLGCRRVIARGSRCNTCRNRQKAAYATTEYEALRRYVLERDEYECQLKRPGCEGIASTADHITPMSQGGPTTPENLQAACRHCNSGKRDR